AAIIPPGKKKTDEFFGESEIYRDALRVVLPYTRAADAPAQMTLQLRSQGCADIGLCYPPQTWTAEVALPVRVASTNNGGVDLMALLQDNAQASSEFLHPDEAFRFVADMADDYTLAVRFKIAEGYYLYRDKFAFTSDSQLVQFGTPRLPAGTPKTDEFFGATEVFYNQVEIRVPMSRAGPEPGDFNLNIGFQGCAEDGICYPPMTRDTVVLLPAASSAPPGPLMDEPVSEQDRLAETIRSGNLGLVALMFFGTGLLLAFTPCVFPMVPILSGIIVGQGPDITTRRAFTLSAIFVVAMALTYTAAGVAAALLGQNLQAVFQQPAVIIVFSLVFVALALAMFGTYEFQMPAAMQDKLNEMSNKQSGGTLFGVGIMGVLSALIVGPCVAAPLAAALIVIGQSGDPLRGGLALFVMSLGMGAPLLVFGASAGHLLPRAGAWMTTIRGAFGVLMLGIAIWMLSRILPDQVTMFLWAGLVLMSGIFLGAFAPLPQDADTRHKLAKGGGIMAVVYGVLLVIGAATGGTDPLRPLSGSSLAGGSATQQEGLVFRPIKSVADLQREVRAASAAGQSTMLDFYADWCVECKKMEKTTFHNPAVLAALGNTVLLQADVTANDEIDRALLNHFGIYGPPTIAFFGRDGLERKNYRVVGYMGAAEFAAVVTGATTP
ncbi:MAG: protein-disulfide reductase DsbD, partial [Gammaproteobacteria bacterium]|nr:protein-disulfide reductase DsbD [Gammaproteobacteria bacterium]NNM21000.1 protein-disulfide reductase DsbD [Gammaproteobacteria bacterium]